MSVGLLFDSTRCIGCGACSAACKEANGLPLPIEDHTTALHLDRRSRTSAARNVRRLCFHCAEPTCASVCPVGGAAEDARRAGGLRRGALHRLPLLHHGVPVRRAEVPVGPARADRRQVHPVRRARRPTGCRPPCAAVCPDRRDAVRRARRAGRARRAARIADSPDGYVDHVYGIDEAGGTSVLMLSSVPFEKLGMKTNVPRQPLPLLTWQVLSKVPSFAVVWGACLFGIHWITKRRDEVRAPTRRQQREKEPMSGAAAMRRAARRVGFWEAVFAVVLVLFAGVTVLRFTRGLGAVTNLSDQFPWGLWIGFDVLCGVGLAAGAFTLTAIVHIFNLHRFEPIVRPTVLTGFLGYLLVIAGLMFDLGQPWRIWHALVFWNPHSVMFEVAWCVMLYTTVLALEFSPVVFEGLRLERPRRILHSLATPLVIVGVILSTLHQSSLGSLYLIVPSKLHPLWYTPLLPFLFLVSAIGAGIGMTILESYLAKRAFGRHLEMDLLEPLARGMVVALGVYGLLRVIVISQERRRGDAAASRLRGAHVPARDDRSASSFRSGLLLIERRADEPDRPRRRGAVRRRSASS